MFGKRNRGNPYYKPKLESIDKNDNLIIQTNKNKITTFTRQSTRTGGSYISPGNTKIYNKLEGITDLEGDVIKSKLNVEFAENLFLWYDTPTTNDSSINIFDKSGNGLDGTIINGEGVEIIYDNELGYVFDFDGTDDYIQVPTLKKEYFSNGFTFCGWVKFNSITGYPTVFTFKTIGGTSNHNLIELFINNSSTQIWHRLYSGTTLIISVSSLNYIYINTWVFISISVNKFSRNVIFYKNAEIINSSSQSSIYADNDRFFNYFGRRFDNSTWFNGQMKDLRFYNRPLTSGEIRLIYINSIKNNNLQLINNSKYIYSNTIPYSLKTNNLQKGLFIWIKTDDLLTTGQIKNAINSGITVTEIGSSLKISKNQNSKPALFFNNTNLSYIRLSKIQNNYFTNEFTWSGWLNTRIKTNFARVWDFGTTTGNNNLLGILIFSSFYRLYLFNSSAADITAPNNCYSNTITDNKWYHIVLTIKYINNQYFFNWYINGIFSYNSSSLNQYNSFYNFSTEPFPDRSFNYIGIDNNGPGNSIFNFFGYMADLRWYSRVLSNDEIYELYQTTYNDYIIPDNDNENIIQNLQLSHFSLDNSFASTPKNKKLYNFNSIHNNKLVLHYLSKDAEIYTDSITDYSGLAHQASKGSNVSISTSTTILTNNSFSFDGTINSTLTANGSSLSGLGFPFKGIHGSTPRTYCGWIYLNSLASRNPLLSYGSNNYSRGLFDVFIDTDGRMAVSLDIETNYYIKFTQVFSTNQWYYLALVVDTYNFDITNIRKSFKAFYGTYTGAQTLEFIQNTFYAEYNLLDTLNSDPTLFIHLPLDNVFYNSSDTSYYTKNLSTNSGISSKLVNINNVLSTTTINFNKTPVFDFDGTNDYLNLSTINTNYLNKGFTFCGWINVNVSQDFNRIFQFNQSSGVNNNAITLMILNPLRFRFSIITSGSATSISLTTTGNLSTNQWYHISVIATNNLSAFNIYIMFINGIFNNSTTSFFDTYANVDRDACTVGIRKNLEFDFDGQMFDLRWYSRFLSTSEIQAIYNQGKNMFNTDTSTNNLLIGKGITGSLNATAYFNGFMNDIRLYARALDITELEYIWNNGNGSYIRGSNLDNSLLLPIISGSNIVLNNRKLLNITHETLFDNTSKIVLQNSNMWLWNDMYDYINLFDYSNQYHDKFIGTNIADDHNRAVTGADKIFKLNKILTIDDNNTTININNNFPASYFNNGFSISLWMSPLFNFSGGYIYHFTTNSGTDINAIALYINNTGQLRSYMHDNSNTSIYSLTYQLPTNNIWYNVSITLDIDNNIYYPKIYIDGNLKVSNTISGTYNITSNDRTLNFIGVMAGKGTQAAFQYDGYLSDMRFYSSVLTDNDIWNIYQDRASSCFDLHNTTMCDFYPLSITDTIHTTTQATQKLKSIIDLEHYQPTALSNITSNLSLSLWVYPKTLHSGTLLANSRGSNNKLINDFRIGIDPIEYSELELHLLGQNHTLSGNTVSNIYDSSKNNKSISFSNINVIDSNYSYEIFDFNGVNSYINIPTLDTDIFQDGFTFTTWFKYTSNLTSSNIGLFNFSNTTLGNSSKLFLGGSTTSINDLQLTIGTSNIIIPDYLSNINNSWTHLALIFNSNYDARIYKNGDLFYSNTSAFSSINNTLRNDNYIGGGYLSNIYEFEGQMNDIRLYSRYMNQDEIIKIYKKEEQLTFTNFTSNSTYNIYTSNVYLDNSTWAHIGINYSNTIGKIEFYKNSQIKTTLSSGDITIPQLNTSNLSIGNNQDTGLNKNVLNADLCDIIIKPNQITYAETFKEIFNMEHKLLLDIQTRPITYKYNNIFDNKYFLYDNANYYKYNSNHNSIYQLFNNLELKDIEIITDDDFDYVIRFTGSTQYIKITGPVSTEPLVNFNVSFWINLLETKTNNSEFVIISKWIDNNYFKITINYLSSQLKIYFEDSLDASYNFTSFIIKGLWQHISINFHNSVGIFLYINGEYILQEGYDIKFKEGKEIDTSDNNTIKYITSNIYIGYTDATAFEGKIADIKIYDGILNPNAIKNLYNKSRKLEDNIVKQSIFNTTNDNYVKDYEIDLLSNCVLNLNTNLITRYDDNNFQLTNNILIDNSQHLNNLLVSNNNYITISTTEVNSTITQSLNLDNSSNDTNNAYIYLDYPIFTNVNNFTLSSWFNASTMNGKNYLIYNGSNNAVNDEGYGIYLENSNINIMLNTNVSSNILTPDIISNVYSVSSNTWYHISYSRDNTNNYVHVNGLYIDLTNNNQLFQPKIPQSAFSIGALLNYELINSNTSVIPQYKFNGKIADVRLYDTCLSNSQIEFLAKGTPKLNHYKNEIIFSTANKQTYKNKLITSKYTIDTEGKHDGVLPVISRDNLIVHYDFNSLNLISNPNQVLDINNLNNSDLVLDINNLNKSALVYLNPSFIDKRQGYTNYNGSMINITLSEPGYINSNCALFNGSNSCIAIANGANLDTNSGKQWTINCWIKPDYFNITSNSAIWAIGGNANGKYMQFIDANDYNTLKLEVINDDLQFIVYNTNKVINNDDKWHMITTTFGSEELSSNILTIYLDGVKVFKYIESNVNNSPSSNNLIYLGSDNPFSNTNMFAGRMDNIQIWNTNLKDYEITRLYNGKDIIGPVNYWTADNIIQDNFDSNIVIVGDLGIADYNLHLNNVAIRTDNSIIGNSYFNLIGSDSLLNGSYLYCNKLSIIGDNPRTYSMWIRINETIQNELLVFSYGDNNMFKCYIDNNNSVKIRCGNELLYSANNVINNNQWYNLVLVIYSKDFYNTNGVGNTKNIRLFLNARYIKLTSSTLDIIDTRINPITNNLGLYFGRVNHKDSFYLVMYIYEMANINFQNKIQLLEAFFYNNDLEILPLNAYRFPENTIDNTINDRNSSTKWYDEGNQAEQNYIVYFYFENSILPNRYQLRIAEDTNKFPNRNPDSWQIIYTENFNYTSLSQFESDLNSSNLSSLSNIYQANLPAVNFALVPGTYTSIPGNIDGYWNLTYPDNIATSNSYNFSLDDIRIYNSTLAIDEIQNIYNNSRNYEIIQLE